MTIRVVDIRTIDGKVVIASSLICQRTGKDLTVMRCGAICVFETGEAWMRSRGAGFLKDQAFQHGAVPTEECIEALVAANADVIPEVALAAVRRPLVKDAQLLVWAGLMRPTGMM